MPKGTEAALSRSSRDRSACGSPILYPNISGDHFRSRPMALAYGSSTTLAELNRWPLIGSYGPETR